MGGADQRQKIGMRPMGHRAAPFEESGGADQEGTDADRGHGYFARAPSRRMKSMVSTSASASATPAPPDTQIRSSGGLSAKAAGRQNAKTTVAHDGLQRLRQDVDFRIRKPAGRIDRRRRAETAQDLERAGEVELGDSREEVTKPMLKSGMPPPLMDPEPCSAISPNSASSCQGHADEVGMRGRGPWKDDRVWGLFGGDARRFVALQIGVRIVHQRAFRQRIPKRPQLASGSGCGRSPAAPSSRPRRNPAPPAGRQQATDLGHGTWRGPRTRRA